MMNDNGINHRDAKGMYTSPLLLVPPCISLTVNLHSFTGITQKISDLQSPYNSAHDWKRNTGAGILDSNTVNGVKTVDDQIHASCRYWDILDPIMGSRSVAEPLFTRSSFQYRFQQEKKEGEKKTKINPEEFYMQLVITKRQAKMTKARAMATKAKVSYTRELREMGLDFNEIKKISRRGVSSYKKSDGSIQFRGFRNP
ncbi:hypothetical protein VP01_3242g3 [Puccinia sorghi]|uniref:No apical meristem-associated C-terminal domain-containing protein n=1 Tax=Puccinia sorghi TaxID=27349 RepID=A0A0L6UZZ4_9BASI|nr:hypothetical protein VP01_3242g3 [Puccinia sorghi]